jgi:hypothetical protein
MTRSYPEPAEGEWVQPVRKGWRLACCDCGLVHTFDFRIRKGHIEFRAWRNNRATGQRRRKDRG